MRHPGAECLRKWRCGVQCCRLLRCVAAKGHRTLTRDAASRKRCGTARSQPHKGHACRMRFGIFKDGPSSKQVCSMSRWSHGIEEHVRHNVPVQRPCTSCSVQSRPCRWTLRTPIRARWCSHARSWACSSVLAVAHLLPCAVLVDSLHSTVLQLGALAYARLTRKALVNSELQTLHRHALAQRDTVRDLFLPETSSVLQDAATEAAPSLPSR